MEKKKDFWDKASDFLENHWPDMLMSVPKKDEKKKKKIKSFAINLEKMLWIQNMFIKMKMEKNYL